MAVVLASVRQRIVEALNMSSSDVAYGTISTATAETWSKSGELDAAILSADGDVVKAIINNLKHPRRGGFLTSAAVSHLGTIASHVGSVEAVIIGGKRATIPLHPDPMQEIERERSNVLGLTLIEPHYFIFGSNILCHNGSGTATVSFCGYTRTGVCQSPDEYEEAVMDGAMATLFDRDGMRPDAAGYRANRFQAALQMIALAGQEAAA